VAPSVRIGRLLEGAWNAAARWTLAAADEMLDDALVNESFVRKVAGGQM